VCRRVAARAGELGLTDRQAYEARLASDPSEREALYRLCFVTISRFYRDRRTYDVLRDVVLPSLASAVDASGCLDVWSAGCASGEEPFSVAILWRVDVGPKFPNVSLRIVATDFDETVLARALRGELRESSLRETPQHWREAAFEPGEQPGVLVVREELRRDVRFVRADIRTFLPEHRPHLVLARNSVFTYFDATAQADFVRRVAEHIVPNGYLVVGARERLGDANDPKRAFEPCTEAPGVYRRR
jgi:chemotaxis protein methyltransferase CheR